MRQTRGPVDQHVLLVEDEHRLSEMLQLARANMDIKRSEWHRPNRQCG